MKYNFPVILIVLLGSTLLLNCNCKHLCTSPVPVLNFVNFDSASLHVVIIKEYNNNGQFSDLQRTKIFSSDAVHSLSSDTMQFDSIGISLEYFTDYTIEVPATGSKWYLENISMQPAKMSGQYCTNGIKYFLNDTLHTIPPASTASNSAAVIHLNR